jgi:hypothetical protein
MAFLLLLRAALLLLFRGVVLLLLLRCLCRRSETLTHPTRPRCPAAAAARWSVQSDLACLLRDGDGEDERGKNKRATKRAAGACVGRK